MLGEDEGLILLANEAFADEEEEMDRKPGDKYVAALHHTYRILRTIRRKLSSFFLIVRAPGV